MGGDCRRKPGWALCWIESGVPGKEARNQFDLLCLTTGGGHGIWRVKARAGGCSKSKKMILGKDLCGGCAAEKKKYHTTLL